ncbi:pyrroline-5-carboxylate reductase [Shewanella abyssi]|uniref:pyrroline-5-carboxylate reductase n=1 Tax=Shewanella abyssi TaxID=311789 RepID=UPI00200F015C|nr:pyrroline-5-carboxylate reductase [Shewanella abyssi]MCL1051285.1 pyrroline-5-carboxylate reductase [Shewanella abyssi]
MSQKKVCFIGAGNMTRSIVSGLVKSGYSPQNITASNPSQAKLDALSNDFGISVTNDNIDAATTADVIILGVKPHLMQHVGEQLSGLDLSTKLIITIAAGVTAKRYSDFFKQEIKLIRTMPNTPTQIGVGLTGLFAGDNISTEYKTLCETLMATGGEVVWVDKEDDLNQVIALAGSSPAYFFLFLESMVESAIKGGISEASAREMAQQAALGAALMAKQNPDLSLAQLRQNVTSKGGTTAQAVATFEAGNLRGLVDNAMSNCVARAQEMAKQY